MQIHDEFIPPEDYARIQSRVPEACVEVFLEHDGVVLLVRRTNEPAKGEWFWPGSRLYKGETLEAAAHRVAREELGLEVELTGQLGVYEHFWDTSAVEGVDTRHTVNVVFRATPVEDEFEITLDDQHDDVRFLSAPEPGLHEYVRRYLGDAGYNE
jgi:colanic acid biosynthesis protein WcaH